MDTDRVKKGLKTSIFGKYFYYFPEIDSTNSYASRLAHEGAPEGTVVLTDYQTAGRGRQNRVWEASKDANILMSIILRPRLNIEHVIRITLASAEILLTCLEKFLKKKKVPVISFKVKWPNDILANGKKISGILAESSVRNKEVNFVVVGIGLNVNQDVSELSKQIRQDATSLLAETGREFEREKILAEIITTFEQRYFQLERTNYNQVLSDWKKRCDHMGEEVIIETHIGVEKGKFLDVTEKGIVISKDADGEVKELVSVAIKSLKAVHGTDD
jgi:BirA family biotin operon repressor/biotin-[acetyl-CoA-carboxylase] ligase